MDYLCDYCMHVMSLCEIVFILALGIFGKSLQTEWTPDSHL